MVGQAEARPQLGRICNHAPMAHGLADILAPDLRCMLPAMHCLQHPFEHHAHVFIHPRLRLARHIVYRFGGRDVGAAQPDVDGDLHDRSAASSASSLVIGAWHAKLRQT